VEKRKSVRYEVQLSLSFSGSEVAGGGLVTSLSKEGCSVTSEEPVRPKTYLTLRLQLPEQRPPLRIEAAEVRWSSGSGFGLEFMHLRAEEQERLRRYITWLETTQNN
jgi:hypothetical protein